MSEDHPQERSLLRRVLFLLKFLEIRLRFIFILVVTAVVVGYWDHIQNYYERWQRTHQTQQMPGHEGHKDMGAVEQEFEYYCGMHPFVVRDRPGKCPICGMDLVQRKKGEPVTLPEGTLARVQVSPQRIMQGGIQVEPVLYRTLTHTIRSYGVAEPAEGRLAKIVARFPGRVQDLMVDAVGIAVNKGDALARIYSPKYLAASQEYIRAVSSQQKGAEISNPDTAALEKTRAEQLAAAARRRLALAGFTEGQLDAIAESGKVSDTVTLYSPLSGTVIEKSILLGEAVEEGTPIFTVADLSALWMQVKVMEADIAAVKMGMPVEITTVAWPGIIFYGNVDFIYPILDTENRTVKVRVTVANPDGKLKPGMFANAVIRAPIGEFAESDAEGKPKKAKAASDQTAEHAGKHEKGAPPPFPTTTQEDADKYLASLPAGAQYYVCSMHPNVVSDKPGQCPLCNMTLEKKQKEGSAAGHEGHQAGAQVPSVSLPTKTQEDADKYVASLSSGAEYYQCSMHANVVSDKPGDCPLCGMKLDKKQKESAPVAEGPGAGSMERWTEGYACPMHPDELSDKPGICTTCNCGMKMVHWRVERVLSVPETAVIDTGEKKVVYVETAAGVYDARAVTLGARAGSYYPVIDGLTAGQRIVTQGAFLIDAEARLNPATAKGASAEPGKPSPPGHAGMAGM